MGLHRLQWCAESGAVDLGEHRHQEGQCGAYPFSGAPFSLWRAYEEGFAQELKQQIELIVLCHQLLTGLGRVVVLLETLVKSGRAFGTLPFVRGVVFLAKGARGFSLQLMQPIEEVAKLMEIITHPQRLLARRLIACDHSLAAIGGHAKAVETVIVKLGTMVAPGLGRTIRSQLNVEDGGTLRLDRDSNGRLEGKNFIAEIHDDLLRCHGYGRREGVTRTGEEVAEIAHGMRLVLQRFQEGSNARNRAFPFPTPQQDQLVETMLILLKKTFFIAKEPFQMQVGHSQQLREESPGEAITRCDLRHFPLDALIKPRQHDKRDTGLSISIWSSHQLHCCASGRWSVVMNPQDSLSQSSSYHHQRFG